MTATIPRLNDVFKYRTDDGQYHCREGVAVAVTDYDGSVVLIDTFWKSRLDDLAHRLTMTERATLTFLGNLDDYRDITMHAQREYAAEDCLIVPSQHDKANSYYVRIGSKPDRATILGNAEREVAKAEQELAAAERHLENVRAELDRLRRA